MKEVKIIDDLRLTDVLHLSGIVNEEIYDIKVEDLLNSLTISDISIYLDRRKKAVQTLFYYGKK